MKSMKKLKRLILPLLALFVFASATAAQEAATAEKKSPVPLQTTQKMRNETRYLVTILERGHYLRTPITDLDVREFIREYMQSIDFFKLFYTVEDVQYFQDFFAPSIDIMLRQGTLLPAFSIYDKFLERADARIKWIEERMKQPFDFDTKDTFVPDRSKEDWPKNMADADALWEKRLKFDLINQILSYSENAKDENTLKEDDKTPTPEEIAEVAEEQEKAPKTFEEKLEKAKEEVLKRYKRLVENYQKADAMEIQEIYLNALARLYDPHTSFLSEYYREEFDISVRNSLVGIGALLQDKDGYCTLAEIMPGGPAEESKLLKPGDKILAVGQETGDMVDVIGMKLRKTVRMIRGKEGTKVRLLIEPADNPGSRKTITLVRKEIKLTTKLAKAALYDVPYGDDKTIAIGVIDLPAFYGEGAGETKGFSTTKDVEELLTKLKSMGAKGIVLDLRRNGGGFLDEAVNLTGLFIDKGPVVQVRDTAGRINTLSDEDPKVAWDGPLVILVSRLSASASEILAGALKDHKRALIVGDKRTHGKGTVQAVWDLSRFDPEQKSSAKITIQKWYAPSGDSIQIEGVHSDIVLPSAYDYMEIGEEYKDYAMKWDKIRSADIEKVWAYGVPEKEEDALIAKLREDSEERQKTLEEFKVWNDRIDWIKNRQEKKDWSLNLKDREDQLKSDEAFNDSVKEHQKELAPLNFKNEEVLLESAKENEHKDAEAAAEKPPEKRHDALEFDPEGEDEAPEFDVQLREALRIMTDWIEIIDNPAELEKGEKSGNDVKIETGAPAGDQIPASELQDAA